MGECLQKYDKEYLIKEFWRYYDENGVYPKKNDMKRNKGYPSSDSYVSRFGSWNGFMNYLDLISEDGWYKIDENVLFNYYSHKPQQFIIDKMMIKRSWSTIKFKASKLGLKRDRSINGYTCEYMINEMIRYIDTNGFIPTHDQFSKDKNFISTKAIKKRFKTWNKFLEACGLSVSHTRNHTKEFVDNSILKFYEKNNRTPIMDDLPFSRTLLQNYYKSLKDACVVLGVPISKTGFGRNCLDDNGNLNLSSTEINISNFLISNGIDFKKDVCYQDIFLGNTTNKTMDWLLYPGRSNIVVEYFGMYRSKSKNIIHKNYVDSIKQKYEILHNNNHMDKSIMIYPSDIKEKTLNDIFSKIL